MVAIIDAVDVINIVVISDIVDDVLLIIVVSVAPTGQP